MKNEKLLFGILIFGVLAAIFVEINFPTSASSAAIYEKIGIFTLLAFLTYRVIYKKK